MLQKSENDFDFKLGFHEGFRKYIQYYLPEENLG